MTCSGPAVSIGMFDWRHQSWNGTFYPEDLPAEWQLAYYANEWRCVMLPYRSWAEGSVDQISRRLAEWREEVDPEFQFLLEPPPPGDCDSLRQMAAEEGLGSQLALSCRPLWRSRSDASASQAGMIAVDRPLPGELRQLLEEFVAQLPADHGWLIVAPLTFPAPDLDSARALNYIKSLSGY
jgi:hypothetical protein